MSSFVKREYELFALLLMNRYLPELVPLDGTAKGESPDWQNDSYDFGIEVVRAESDADGDAKAFSNAYIGKPISEIPKKRFKRLADRLSVSKENTLGAVEMFSFYGRMESDDPTEESPFAKPIVDRCEEKLKLLNNEYKQFGRNILCIYLLFSPDVDSAHVIYKCYEKRAKQYNVTFSDLFFIGLSSVVYIDCIKKLIYHHDTINDNGRNNLDGLVHKISALPVCEDGMVLYDELKKQGVKLEEGKALPMWEEKNANLR